MSCPWIWRSGEGFEADCAGGWKALGNSRSCVGSLASLGGAALLVGADEAGFATPPAGFGEATPRSACSAMEPITEVARILNARSVSPSGWVANGTNAPLSTPVFLPDHARMSWACVSVPTLSIGVAHVFSNGKRTLPGVIP